MFDLMRNFADWWRPFFSNEVFISNSRFILGGLFIFLCIAYGIIRIKDWILDLIFGKVGDIKGNKQDTPRPSRSPRERRSSRSPRERRSSRSPRERRPSRSPSPSSSEHPPRERRPSRRPSPRERNPRNRGE